MITRFISMHKQNSNSAGIIKTQDQKNSTTQIVLEQTSPTAPTEQTYTVKENDTLSTISMNYYRSEDFVNDLVAKNNIENPDIISVGQVLIIPPVDKNKNGTIASGVQTNQVTINSDSYTVKYGDNLWQIAEEAYGDGMMWKKLASANNIENPDLLNEGSTLKIPKDSTNLQTFVMPSF